MLWTAWVAILPLILLSGERKALIIHLFLSMLLLVRKRNVVLFPVIGIVLVGVIGIAVTSINNPYLTKQLHTLTHPEATGDYETVLATGHFAEGDTPSNAQRNFALMIGLQLFRAHPVTGVGTNKYVDFIEDKFWYLPDQMRVSIHGEFLRILAENGGVGFAIYLLTWLVAWVRTRRAAQRVVLAGLATRRQARLFPFCLFLPIALFVGTEAAGTRAFVALVLVSMMPDLLRFLLASRFRRSTRVAAVPAFAALSQSN
jgi:hypothetical protein